MVAILEEENDGCEGGRVANGDPTKKVPQLNFGNENNRNAAPGLIRAREAEGDRTRR